MIRFFTFLFIIHTLCFGYEKNIDLTLPTNYTQQRFIYKGFTDLYNTTNKDYTPYNININNYLSKPTRKLAQDTFYMQIFMLGTMAVLVALPESISNWDLDELQKESLSDRWKEHVKAGPVIDKDDFFINYIGHPVSGAWYYTMARNDGLDEFDSFLYSVFVSTFVWEYGYEAFAEIPSLQDLIATPVVGSLLGEYFHHLELSLDKNNGKIFNSTTLGNIGYFFLNPIGMVANSLDNMLHIKTTMYIEAYNPTINKAYTYYSKFMIRKPQEFYNTNYMLVTRFTF